MNTNPRKKRNCSDCGSMVDRLNPKQRFLVERLRFSLRECATHIAVDELARLVGLAFQAEFSVGGTRHAVAHAVVRGILARRQLLREEGGSISTKEAAEKLGVSKSAVLNRYRRGTVLGFYDENSRTVRFPVWQFADTQLLPGIAETLELFNGRSFVGDDMGRLMFFLCEFEFLGGRRPLDCLRSGEFESVRRAALGYLD